MSKTVDKRVVEMRFDNDQFEQNVKTSMSTLDKLKHALKLDGASKGLNDISKASKGLDFSSIASNVETLASRFSTMGIIGMTVLSRMTNSCIDFATKGIGYVTNKIVEGGKRRAFNIENAHFQLQGLLKDEEKVQAVMADAMESVDGTAYAYDEAAKAASQFAASGLQAGEEMLGALRGITGVAAMTNSEYEGISRIFTTVAGNGRLMGDQLLQLSSRGLNAASTLAEYFNGVKDGSIKASESVTKAIKGLSKSAKTSESDIREWVSKGKISFEIFSAAMDDAFGEHAKRANETFNGAMANMGAALSRIGAKFVSPLIEQNGPFVKLFNTIRERINEVNKLMDPFANKYVHTVSSMAEATAKYLSSVQFMDSIQKVMPKLARIFNHFVGTLKNVASIAEPFVKRIFQTLHLFTWELDGNRVITPLDRLADALTHVQRVTGEWSYKINNNHKLLDNWRSTVKGVYAVFDILRQVIVGLIKVFAPANSEIASMADGMLTLTGGVGEWLYDLDMWLRKDNVIETSLKDFKKTLENTVDYIIDKIPGLRNFLDYLDVSFSNITKSDVTQFIKEFGRTIDNVIQEISGFGSEYEGMDLLTQSFKVAKEEVGNFITTMTGAESPVLRVLDSIYNKLKTTMEKASDIVKRAKERFAEFFSTLDPKETAVDLFKGGSLIYSLYQVGKLVESIDRLNKRLSSLATSISGYFNTLKKNAKYKPIVMVAKAIAILAGSLFLLAQCEPERLEAAGKAISKLAFQVALYYAALQTFNQYGKLGDLGSATNSLYTIVIAIGAMALILKKLSEIKPEEMEVALIGLTGLTVSLAVLSVVLGTSGRELTAAVPGVKMAVTALYAIVGALILMRFIDPKTIGPGLVGVVALLAAIVGFMGAIKGFKLNDLKIDPSIGPALIEIAAAVAIMAVAIKMLAGYNLIQIAQGTIGVAGALVLLLGSLKYIDTNFSNTDSEKLIAAAGAMMMVAVAVDLLLPSILALGKIPWDALLRGLGATMLGIVALAAALEFTAKTASTGQLLAAGAGMLMIAAAMDLLIPVVVTMGLLPWRVVAQGLGLFLAGLLGFAVVGHVATSAAVGLIALGSSLVMISSAIVIAGVGIGLVGEGLIRLSIGLMMLSTIGTSALPKLVENLKTMLTMFLTMLPDIFRAVADALSAFLDTILTNLQSLTPRIAETFVTIMLAVIATFVTIAPAIVEAIFAVLTEVLRTLSKYLPEIAGIIVDFFIAIINMVGDKAPAIVHAIVTLLKNIFNAVLDEIKSMDIQVVVDNLKTIGLMAAMLVAFAGLAVLAPPAMVGVGAFGIVVTELSGVLAALGALYKIPGLTDFINGGGELLEEVGEAIGKFIGGIIGEAVEGVMSKLPSIGSDLTQFMHNLHGFIIGCEAIKPETLESAKILAEVILALTGASILDGITRFFGFGESSLSTFGKELEKFGPHFAAYAASVSGIDSGTVVASARAAEALADMAKKLPNEGGVLAYWLGDNKLGDFAKGLIPFGSAIAVYSRFVSGMELSGVEASAKAGTILADMAKTLPNEGGVLAYWVGDNKLGDFAKGLIPFGSAIAVYSRLVKGIDASAIESSANAATVVSDMAKKLPNSGGAISWIVGDNTLSQFGKELADFGPHFAKYANSISGINTGIIQVSSACIQTLVDISNSINNKGGLVSLVTGEGNLEIFGGVLESFGKSFYKYYENIAGADITTMSSATEQIQKLIELATSLAGKDTSGLRTFGNDLKNLGMSGVEQFTAAFRESSVKINEAVSVMTGYVRQALTTQQAYYRNAGINSGQALVAGVQTSITRGKSAILSNIKALGTSIISTTNVALTMSKFMNIASNNVIGGLLAGLRNAKTNLFNEIKAICEEAIKKFIEGFDPNKLNKVGKDTIDNIRKGMESGESEIVEAVNRICGAILEAFQNGMKPENYTELGVQLVTAMVKGIENSAAADSNGVSPLSAAVTRINAGIVAAFRNGLKSSIFVDIGRNIVNGLKSGMSGSGDSAARTASEVTSKIVSAVKSTASSAVNQAKKAGELTATALTSGMDDYTDTIEANGEDMIDRLMDSAKAAYLAVNYILEHEFANGPVIKPVIDLSNVDPALQLLQNGFDNSLSTRMISSVNMGFSKDSLEEFANRFEKMNTLGNDNIVNEIKQLRTDVNALNASMSRLQVVMDSGALVGSIVPAMDSQLGSIALLKSRGV